MNVAQLEQIIRKLQWKRRDDPTAPSLTLSYLYREKMYYGSLVRYDQSFAHGSKVVTSVKRNTLEGVLVVLLNEVQLLPEPIIYDYTTASLYDPSDDIPF